MVAWEEEIEVRWKELANEITVEMREWRKEHPKATLRAIEEALDERWAKMRAKMVEDVALTSQASGTGKVDGEDWAQCPKCGHKLEAHGRDSRELTTNHNQTISLKRAYGRCPACGAGLFPPG